MSVLPLEAGESAYPPPLRVNSSRYQLLFVSSPASVSQSSSLSGEVTAFRPFSPSSEVRAERSGDVSFIWSWDWLGLGVLVERRPKETTLGSGVEALGVVALSGESGGRAEVDEGEAGALVIVWAMKSGLGPRVALRVVQER